MSDEVLIRSSPLRPGESEALAAVAARAFLHDPLAVAVFAGSAEERERRLRCVYGAMFRASPQPPLSAWSSARPLGLAGLAPARAVPPIVPALRALPLLLRGARLRELRPAYAWLRGIAAAPGLPGDWRLGPLVVDPEAQGRGSGSALVKAACERLDELAAGLLVSTDVAANVGFYRRFGFDEIDQGLVVGQRVWHLRRPPARGAASQDRQEGP